MYLAFSNIFETTEKAGNIPVAIVAEQENAAASMMFEELSKGDEALLKVQKMTAEEADKALKNGDIKGIYYTDSSLRLKVKETGMEQTILQMISKHIADGGRKPASGETSGGNTDHSNAEERSQRRGNGWLQSG